MNSRLDKTIREYALITLGAIILSVGVYFFQISNNLSIGGVTGLSVILSALIPSMSVGRFVLIINAFLILIGFIFIGKDFGIKTVFGSFLYSLFIPLLEWIYPMSGPLTQEPLLEFVCAAVISPIGSALMFYNGASTGGTDIIAMMLKKRFSLNISKALFIVDILIVMASAFVFGFETWLFAVLVFFSNLLLINYSLSYINTSSFMTAIISSEHAEELREFITGKLERSATISDAFTGAYEKTKKSVFLVVVNRREGNELKKIIRTLDEKAFVIVSKTDEILGEGFREPL